MKLDKKNIIVILLMGLFIMILCIKYYAGINVKSEFNHNEVGAPVNKEDSYYNDSNELEEKQDNKNSENSQKEKDLQEKNAKAKEEKITEHKQESNNKNNSTSSTKKDETSVLEKDTNSNKDTNNRDNTIKNNATIKNEGTTKQPKEENNNVSSLSISNDNLRKNIKSKYGVAIGYKDESDVNYINSYSNFTKQYDDEKIHIALNNVNAALAKYLSSFFFEINKKWKSLTIHLLDQLTGNVAGLTDNRNPNNVVILINTESLLFESTLHHEIMHYIDCYLASIIGASALESSMKYYNPPGFTYGNQTT